MPFEFEVPQRVIITTMDDVHGVVVDRHTDSAMEMNFYHVAFKRFDLWSIDVFPEISLAAERRGIFSRWFKRGAKEKPSEITRPLPAVLGADVQLPPGMTLPATMKDKNA